MICYRFGHFLHLNHSTFLLRLVRGPLHTTRTLTAQDHQDQIRNYTHTDGDGRMEEHKHNPRIIQDTKYTTNTYIHTSHTGHRHH